MDLYEDWSSTDINNYLNNFNDFNDLMFNQLNSFFGDDEEEDEERVLPPVIVTAPPIVNTNGGGLPFGIFGPPLLPFLPAPFIDPGDLLPDVPDCVDDLIGYILGADFPDGVDMGEVRDAVNGIVNDMFNASRNALPDIPNAFVEYAAFVVQYADGTIGVSTPFSDLSSDTVNLTGPEAAEFLVSLEAGDRIVGLIHTQSQSNLASVADAGAFAGLAAALANAGLPVEVALDGVNYIIGPDGQLREYASNTYDGSEADSEGPSVDENGNLQCDAPR